ncbi:hypothetical protein [Shewanella sp. T24-MNA-CIBAN-0130]|uniref:GNAT family N-acetyltransferase n=1 Tax=Shewanella sp. T24-MNA-CIBAN-0130 TaxID=3140470 RepID=UPI003322B204
MIRNAEHKDLITMLDIGKETLAKAPAYPVDFDEKKAAYMVRRCIADKNMCAFVSEVNGIVVGFILGIQEAHFFSQDWYATDLTFCVDEQYLDQGVWLLRRFIRWCKANPKVKSITLGLSSGIDSHARVGKLYECHGLNNIGGLYHRNITKGSL